MMTRIIMIIITIILMITITIIIIFHSMTTNVILVLRSAYYCDIYVRPHPTEITESVLDKASGCFILINKNEFIVNCGRLQRLNEKMI